MDPEAPDDNSAADAVDSDEAEPQGSPATLPASPLFRGRLRPRRTVFERLSEVHRCRFELGQSVLVRDRDEKEHTEVSRPSEDDWNPGIVTSLQPLKVRLKGGHESFTWREIKELPKSRSASPSPSSTWSTKHLPASVKALRRARKLSKRRRQREKEAERKEMELWARAQRIQCAKLRNAAAILPERAAEQKKGDRVKKIKEAKDMVLQSLEDMELPKESPKAFRASPGRAQAKQPMGPGVSALKVTKFCKDLQHFLGPLPGFNFRLRDLDLLTVQDKKDLLKKLSHPRPEAVHGEAFFEWIRQQLQNFRMHRSCGELPQVAGTSTLAKRILTLLRACIQRSAPKEEDHQSLERFAKALKDANLQLEHLDRLPQSELKDLVGKFGIQMTGMTKADVIQKLKTDLWSRRTKSSGARSNEDDLCRYEPAEAIAAVRRLVKKAEEEKSAKAMTVWELHQWLAQYNARVKDLSCLLPAELRQLTSWLKMPPLRSKEDILEWLQREVWREQMQRAPSKTSRFLKLSSKANQRPLKSEVCSEGDCEEESEDDMLLVDLNRPLAMEYDMFVPE